MTPSRKPYGCVFCPIGAFSSLSLPYRSPKRRSHPLSLVQLDDDMRDPFGDARSAPHRARSPPSVVLVWSFVGAGPAHVECVDVAAGRLLAGVGHRAFEQL